MVWGCPCQIRFLSTGSLYSRASAKRTRPRQLRSEDQAMHRSLLFLTNLWFAFDSVVSLDDFSISCLWMRYTFDCRLPVNLKKAQISLQGSFWNTCWWALGESCSWWLWRSVEESLLGRRRSGYSRAQDILEGGRVRTDSGTGCWASWLLNGDSSMWIRLFAWWIYVLTQERFFLQGTSSVHSETTCRFWVVF